ncbi:hypothetical protein QZH41_000506 [Actinostola sp. cb2023]|nr:hypothetical protein QZH41_000506 [Actinostola sp. cb2023]
MKPRVGEILGKPALPAVIPRLSVPPFCRITTVLDPGTAAVPYSMAKFDLRRVYPSDDTNVTDSSGMLRFGNDVMEENKALEIVEMVLAQFKKKGLRTLSLENIINIESKQGKYLVELQLLDGDTKKSVRFSEYVYLPKGSNNLCYPEGFMWNKTSMVNFIVTSGRNQGKWVYHFIQNMAKIYEETKDNNFNVIINDFLCPDADIKQALESSSLPNYLYLTNTGNFQKTLGIQQAADAITDPNGIVVVLDLHLDVPSYFLDDIRKAS